jgi:drug/metabolite transporter (DMT)-like permease
MFLDSAGADNMLSLNMQEEPRSPYQVFLLAIPTVFDLIATVLMNVGLLSVTASVYQMMRGAEMLFAAFFAVIFLQRQLNKLHFLGIFCCVVSLCRNAAMRVPAAWQHHILFCKGSLGHVCGMYAGYCV